MKMLCDRSNDIQQKITYSKCPQHNADCDCHRNPCQHGTCLSQQREGYYYTFCHCHHGFSGRFCEQHIDNVCPCLNGGVCVDNHSKCACAHRYYGDFCQNYI